MKKLLRILPIILVALTLTGCWTNLETEGKLTMCESNLTMCESNLTMCESNLTDSQNAIVNIKNELAKTEKLYEDSKVTVDISSEAEITTGNDINVPQSVAVTVDVFKDQPKYAAGNYSGNTAQLNAYAHNNGVNFTTILNPTTMVVMLKKPVETKGRNLILYVNPKGNTRYCGGRFLTDVEVGQDTFEFDLTDMDIQAYSCDGNRTEKFGNATEIRVEGYITEYNGNKLANIYFK